MSPLEMKFCKPNETKLRFIGGFSDVSSPSLEVDARREAAEEASIEIDGMTYLGSCLVEDSRYIFELDSQLYIQLTNEIHQTTQK